MKKRPNKFTLKELIDFINRADSIEKLYVADKFIDGLDIPDEWRDELSCEIQGSLDIFIDREHFGNPYGYDEDRSSYSPSAPWNAPGMRVSDFIR